MLNESSCDMIDKTIVASEFVCYYMNAKQVLLFELHVVVEFGLKAKIVFNPKTTKRLLNVCSDLIK